MPDDKHTGHLRPNSLYRVKTKQAGAREFQDEIFFEATTTRGQAPRTCLDRKHVQKLLRLTLPANL